MKSYLARYALAGALICALAAAWLNWQFISGLDQTVQIAVVTKEIQPFAPIPEDAVEIRAVSKKAVPADAITDKAALKNQYARTLLLPGDAIRTPHLVAAGGSNLAARLSAEKQYGMRAMALQVNAATGVGGTLREGDPVDILVAIQGANNKTGSGNNTMSKIIARRVPVLYVQTAKEAIGGNNQTTVVLQVPPDKAEEIAFAQAQGQIWLLTNPYESGAADGTETAGVNLDSFLNKYWGVAKVEPKVEPKK